MHTKFFILAVCLSLGFVVECLNEPKAAEVYPDFLFNKTVTRCHMYSTDFCLIPVLIKRDINLYNVRIRNTQAGRFYRIIKLEECYDENSHIITAKDCSVQAFQNFKSNITSHGDVYKNAFVIIDSVIVGRGFFTLTQKHQPFNQTESTDKYSHSLIIISPNRGIDKFHMIFVQIFQVLISVFMGLLIDLNVIMKIVKMPVPVCIGLVCQYLCMPLIAYACIKIFSIRGVNALAMFIYGCCPGGSSSNNWTIMFDGDIDLSVIMTFVSTMASLVFMPAWVYTVGATFIREAKVNIPFYQLIYRLLFTIVPCIIGILISHCVPSSKKVVVKYIKPVIMTVLLSFLALTLYTKGYVYSLVDLKQWLIAPFIPWCGFLIGGFVAFLFRFPVKQIYTIGIETGMQNFGIAFLIIIYNFPSPEADYGILPLVSIGLLTTTPLYFILLIMKIVRKIRGTDKQVEEKEANNEDDKAETLKLNGNAEDDGPTKV